MKLAKLATLHLEWRALNQDIDKKGLTRMTRRGPVIRSEVNRAFKLGRQVSALGSDLGMSPMARVRIREKQARERTKHQPRRRT